MRYVCMIQGNSEIDYPNENLYQCDKCNHIEAFDK